MRYEKSCGAVIYRVQDGKRLYLIAHSPSGKSVIPKGHVEAGETETDTALREIREETGLAVELDTSFREVATYSPKPGIMKDVVFFLAQPCGGTLRPQPGEVLSLEWLSFEEADPIITYPQVRRILQKAEACLSQRADAGA